MTFSPDDPRRESWAERLDHEHDLDLARRDRLADYTPADAPFEALAREAEQHIAEAQEQLAGALRSVREFREREQA